jgi:hypothetical protein
LYFSPTFCCSSATSDCNCRTVVTILVVVVVYGDSSSYSTHLILLRRFSILYPCFTSVDSISVSFPTVVFYGYLVGCVYVFNLFYRVLNRSSSYCDSFECMAASCSSYIFYHLNSIALMVSILTIIDLALVPGPFYASSYFTLSSIDAYFNCISVIFLLYSVWD